MFGTSQEGTGTVCTKTNQMKLAAPSGSNIGED